MKKIMYIMLMGFICFPVCNLFSQARNVYWIHGMGGNSSSLISHETYFKDLYQMNTFRPSVSTSYGISGAAQRLVDLEKVYPDAQNRNILIAHSMGGPNSVWLHKLKGNSYVGGLISLGSPFNGAHVANNIDNGTMDKIVSDGVYKGTMGIRSEIGLLVSWMGSSLVVQTITALFDGKMPGSLYNLMKGITLQLCHKVTDGLTQSTTTRNSLKVGSSEIRALQQHNFNVPSIALYGTERYPKTLRFISSRLSKDGKNIDLVDLVNRIYQTCDSRTTYHSTAATLTLITGQLHLHILHKQLASDWAVSRDYFNGGIQTATDVLTGCYRTTTVTETYQVWVPDRICDDDGKLPYWNTEKAFVPDPICASGRWETRTTTRTVIITEPGDGLLPVATQQAMPGCQRKVEMPHINHEEMKYSEIVRDNYLNNIFKGSITTSRNPEFFIVSKKN